MPTVTVRDETIAGQNIAEHPLELLSERLTVRELIRSRVYYEVPDYNSRRPDSFNGLVRPTDAEQALNGYKLAPGRTIDWQQQFSKASDAFTHNGFFILVDDRQPESLDEELVLTPQTRVSFVKLVPLVGG